MEIENIMSKPVITCHAHETLNDAAERMWNHDCGALAVLDANDRIVGVITDRDICMASYTLGGSLLDLHVEGAMARVVFACDAKDSIETVEQLMRDKQIRRIPIVNSDRQPIGMVTLSDLARHASSGRKSNSVDRQVTQTLAEVCEPRATSG